MARPDASEPFRPNYEPGLICVTVPADAVFGVTVDVLVDEGGFVATVVPPEIFGRLGIGAIFNELHDDCSKFLMRPYSLESIERFQRTFTAIQFPRYVHVYDRNGGSQLEGSLSLFD
jgi:hypothetical protein